MTDKYYYQSFARPPRLRYRQIPPVMLVLSESIGQEKQP